MPSTFVADRMSGTPYTGVSTILQITTAGGNTLPWLEGVVNFSSEEKRDRPPIRGSRRDGQILGLGAGIYEPGAVTLECTPETADIVTTALAAESSDGVSIAEVTFKMQTQLYEEDKPTAPITAIYIGCVITSRKDDLPNTADGLKKAIPFAYVSKTENGKTLFSGARTPS
jgi:hypothetical protein